MLCKDCHTGINRYIVGCKYNTSTTTSNTTTELIDTQWDVNADKKGIKHPLGVELIDTQWDVNIKKNTLVFGVISN